MTFNPKKRLTAALLLSLSLMAVFASQASAKDRNHDGIRDSWERSHHISTKTNQAKRDPDRDGVSNKCEFQANTDPQQADSDADGVKDGAEDADEDGISNRGESRLHSHCGKDSNRVEVHTATITSFVDGVLALDLGGGGTLVAPVSGTLKCERHVSTTPAATAEHGSDDGPNHDAGDDNGGSPGDGNNDKGDSAGNDDATESCTTADLVAGAKVHEAKIADGQFVKIELEG